MSRPSISPSNSDRPQRLTGPTGRNSARGSSQSASKRGRSARRRILALPGGRVPLGAAAALLLAVLAILAWAWLARRLAPLSNTVNSSFDAIIVLGTPADDDGNPTPQMQERIAEGVREYERGVAPRLIFTGGAAHNRFVEAQAMARAAEAEGVPASAVFIEPRAQDTIQNACFSARILEGHGWHSAEVVSSPYHLPRAAILFSRLGVKDFAWRMHAAPANRTPEYFVRAAEAMEVLKTARYLVWSRWTESCAP